MLMKVSPDFLTLSDSDLGETVKIANNNVEEVVHSKESIKVIKEMFSRDKMKVVFFGRWVFSSWLVTF